VSLDCALEEAASRLLVTFAYELGKTEVAATLIELAEAAEQYWMQRAMEGPNPM